MAEFSASDAAIEGVRLAGRKPGAVLIWSLAQFLFAIVAGVLYVLLIGPDFMAISRPEAAGNWEDPAKALSMFMGSLKIDALLLVTLVPWGAVLTCAVYRALLRPQEKGIGYLRFGGDELRMILLALIFVGLSVVAFFAIMVGGILVIGVIAGLVGALSRSADAATAAPLIVLAVFLLVLLVFSWLAVRFSLAAPLTFDRRKLNVFGSWKLTRGHFWALTGAYSMSFVLAFIVFMVGYPLTLVITHLVTGEGIVPLYQMLTRPDFGSLAGYFSGPRILLLALQALYTGLVTAVMHAPSAAAYEMLTSSAQPAAAPQPAREPTGPWG